MAELLDLAATYCQHREHLRAPALHAALALPDGTPAADAPVRPTAPLPARPLRSTSLLKERAAPLRGSCFDC